jgi:hypothetical protein
VTGFHSTIESPDSVSRVAPPTNTMIVINTAIESSHHLMARLSASWRAEITVIEAALE